ncbi:Exonuclease [Macleaya cordata]|uniref:Exonuclease n=1 Tax=Macleaya cordata TaxID=56857 RepID=A0A200QZK6_MACCD|nr:Exonuclease [Macleaya cordata]
MIQKRGMRGAKGGWKEFLNFHDRQLGDCLSDPSKRSIDVLVAFLKTFAKEEDLKFLAKILQCHSNRKAMQQLNKKSSDIESSPQKLVSLTLEHPEYLKNYSFPSHNEDWIVTKIAKISKALESSAMVAVDCEMVLCEDGTEAVVQVCVVDQNLEVKLNELVNPNKPVTDFRTEITGVSAKDLEGVTCSLADIQKSMKKLLSHGTILVGHSLNNDLQALKVDHARVIDTAFIFKYPDGHTRKTPSLNHLCKTVLGYEVREKGAPHNCLTDAHAAMKLVLAKLEHGFDDVIPLDSKEVSNNERAKLLLHRIPVRVSREELLKIFPDSTVKLEPDVRVRGKQYSAAAIFNDPQEAHDAFESIKGEEGKDSSGLPHKLISFQLSTGESTSFFVRKMVKDDPLDQCPSKKRSLEVEETKEETKKPKTDSDQCGDHIKEIQRLKKQLKERDDELINLQKIIAALTRKHGL